MTDNVIWGIDFGAKASADLTEDQVAYLNELAESRRKAWADHAAISQVIPFSTDEYNEPPCA